MGRWTRYVASGLVVAVAITMAAIEPSALASNTTNYSYDAWGRATGATYSGSANVTTGYVYDPAGNRTQVATAAAPMANPAALNVTYASSNNLAPLSIAGPYTSVAVVTQATHGTATVSGTTIKYTPSNTYAGMDSFTYKATNASGSSPAATVLVGVAPKANAGNATVAGGSANNPVSYSVSGTYYSSVAVASLPSHGTANASGTSLTYSPAAGYSGSDTFTYAASAVFRYNGVNIAAISGPATVSITVNPQPPVANTVNASVLYNTSSDNIPLSVTGGTPTSVTVSTQAAHGTATASGTTITYTPAADYIGGDSFYYKATNGGGTSAPAQATITVTGPVLVVTANCGSPPTSVCAVSTTSSYTFSSNPISVSAGSRYSYTYSWTAAGDGQGTWTTGQTTASITPAVSGVASSGASRAGYSVTLTNTTTHTQATSNTVTFLYTHSGS